MNNSVVYLHARISEPARTHIVGAQNAWRSGQNIQFTANYRVRILITTVLYFTGEYRAL